MRGSGHRSGRAAATPYNPAPTGHVCVKFRLRGFYFHKAACQRGPARKWEIRLGKASSRPQPRIIRSFLQSPRVKRSHDRPTGSPHHHKLFAAIRKLRKNAFETASGRRSRAAGPAQQSKIEQTVVLQGYRIVNERIPVKRNRHFPDARGKLNWWRARASGSGSGKKPRLSPKGSVLRRHAKAVPPEMLLRRKHLQEFGLKESASGL
jgi:hypothetical protein